MNETFPKIERPAGHPQGPSESPVPGLIEAWVCASGVDTRYWRTGTGPCVLVLPGPARLVEMLTGQALVILARTHRVLIAETTDAISGAGLRGLIEGLGVAPVGFIASTLVEVALREYLSGRSEAPACVLWLQSKTLEGPEATTLETPESILSNLSLRVGFERFTCWLGDRPDPRRR